MITWNELRIETARRLADAGIETAEPEARWVVEEASGLAGADLALASREAATSRGVAAVDTAVARRVGGEPIQYVLGHWQFFGLDLMVTPDVLIPRPETEVVAGVALDAMVARGARRGPSDAWTATTAFDVVDLGTGSGALALALAAELPEARVWAVDRSEAALEVARANLAGLGTAAHRVRIRSGDWFGGVPRELRGGIRLVVSNPPYVSSLEYEALDASVREHEPREALESGPTGREALGRILEEALDWLEPGGLLVMELAPHQAQAARTSALGRGYRDVHIHDDLSGRPRVLVGERASLASDR